MAVASFRRPKRGTNRRQAKQIDIPFLISSYRSEPFQTLSTYEIESSTTGSLNWLLSNSGRSFQIITTYTLFLNRKRGVPNTRNNTKK